MSKCALHEGETTSGVCLNRSVTEAYFCEVCVKEKHGDCKTAFHLTLKQLSEFLSKEGNSAQLREEFEIEMASIQAARDSISRTGERIISDLEKKVENKKEMRQQDSEEGFKFICDNRNAIALTRKEDDSILVTDNVFGDPDDLEFELGHFQSKLEHSVSEVFKKIIETSLLGSKVLIKEQFLAHAHYVFKNIDRKLHFELPKTPKFKSDYFLIVLKEPLAADFKWKITLDKLNKADRYFEIGLFEHSKFLMIQSTLKSSFLFGSVCACGYNSKGMTGTSPTTLLSSEDGLEDKIVIFVSYTASTKTFKFWSIAKNYNLTGVYKGANKPYLYMCSYYQEETVTIEVLE